MFILPPPQRLHRQVNSLCLGFENAIGRATIHVSVTLCLIFGLFAQTIVLSWCSHRSMLRQRALLLARNAWTLRCGSAALQHVAWQQAHGGDQPSTSYAVAHSEWQNIAEARRWMADEAAKRRLAAARERRERMAEREARRQEQAPAEAPGDAAESPTALAPATSTPSAVQV